MSVDFREKAETALMRHLITRVYPKGVVSIVCDTFDFWRVLTVCSVANKKYILERDGKTVYRPDSGDPVKIICGDPSLPEDLPAHAGAIELLWRTFGGTVNAKGFKVLDPHVGLIYGDSITLERGEAILNGLIAKGFCTTNMVYGIGSYTYQYVTRDTFGHAMKSTYGEVNGEGFEIFKDPVTDSGVKKSAKGRVAVLRENGRIVLKDCLPNGPVDGDLLELVFQDGRLARFQTLSEIRRRVSDL